MLRACSQKLVVKGSQHGYYSSLSLTRFRNFVLLLCYLGCEQFDSSCLNHEEIQLTFDSNGTFFIDLLVRLELRPHQLYLIDFFDASFLQILLVLLALHQSDIAHLSHLLESYFLM